MEEGCSFPVFWNLEIAHISPLSRLFHGVGINFQVNWDRSVSVNSAINQCMSSLKSEKRQKDIAGDV